MTSPSVILCPGQGAQTVTMGLAWARSSQTARATFDEADAVLAESLDAPLSRLCFEGPADALNRTDISQPAIYTCSVACYRALSEQRETPFNPAAVAGLSLGEYTALCLAGAFSFADGLRLVALRGRAMQDAAEAVPSSMVALIGADEAGANTLCDAARGDDILVPANFNAPGQVVISGSLAACERAETLAPDHGLRATRLQVAGAFHSPLMQPAADRLAEALAATPIAAPPAACPVMSNVTGLPHDPDPDAIRAGLVAQLTSPVRWSADCEWLAQRHAHAEWHELAPGKSLTGMMRRIDKAVKVITHDTPETSNA